ncbi:MAG TPA: tyrosine-type recombinase/integrase [Thermoanaerobaculia bacterium]|nr:tyrosine-type recombinase/integrase [Thermoanaerobaculia bacterium]
MLTLFRRHLKKCPHLSRHERRCKCPLHVEGTLRGEYIRRALDLTSWEAAQDCVRDWELGIVHEAAMSIADATARFLEDAAARKLSRESLKKYRGLLTQLEAFAAKRGVRYVRQLDLPALREFRAGWADGAIAGKKKLERLRSFFRFAMQSNWVKQNPVLTMRAPKVTQPPTLPFSKDDMDKILWACDLYPDSGRYRKGTPARLKALTLLMRYSGLRIGDAVTLRTDRVAHNRLFLYTQKTNVPVFCPLPQSVVDVLDDVEPVSERYFFWTGTSDTRSITGNWQRRFQKLFELSGVQDAHPHRFRDTFSVELLLAGVPIEDVSILLGHSSVRITERAYAPWVQARQQKLETAVKKAW